MTAATYFRSLLRETEANFTMFEQLESRLQVLEMRFTKLEFRDKVLRILENEDPNQIDKVDSIIDTIVDAYGSEVYSWDETRLSALIKTIMLQTTSRNVRRSRNAQPTGADFSDDNTYFSPYGGGSTGRNQFLL